VHLRLIDAWKDKAIPFIPCANLYFIILIDFRSDKNNMSHLFQRESKSNFQMPNLHELQVDITCVKEIQNVI